MTTGHNEQMRAVAGRFFGAIEHGDVNTVRQTYHPDVRVWLNTAGIDRTREQNLEVLVGLIAKTSRRAYTERRLAVTADGFVQQHVLHAVHNTGPELKMPAALVCRVENGQIIRLDEYFDPTPLMAWYAAIEAAA